MLLHLLLLSLLHCTTLQLSEKQQKYCTSNDNGDPYKYDLTPLGQVTTPYKVKAGDWIYHVALCGETNIELGGDTSGDAIVQTKPGENHVVGTYILSRSGGEMWVNLVFAGGEPYGHHCNGTGRKAQMLFICDPTVVGNGAPILIDESNDHEDFCFYMFEWSSSLVCPEHMKGPGRGMGVGKLLLIEFIVIVAVYLLLGTAYRRFVLGARGTEQIPNLEFWKSCKEGVKDSVDKMRGGSDGYNPAVSGGINSGQSTSARVNGALNIVTEDDDERLIM